MSLAVLHSRALAGADAPPVTVEVHLGNGLPSFTIVGLPDTEVKESRERGHEIKILDIGGGASAEVMANGLDIVLNDPEVKSCFVNVFGGITACDAVANGILKALEMLQAQGVELTKPIVARIDGNNAEEGRRILTEANHPLIELVPTMDDAARRVAQLAAGK